MDHGAWQTADQDNDGLIQKIIVSYLGAHSGKAGICPELLGPGEKIVIHIG